jgi:hypothetical protein
VSKNNYKASREVITYISPSGIASTRFSSHGTKEKIDVETSKQSRMPVELPASSIYRPAKIS